MRPAAVGCPHTHHLGGSLFDHADDHALSKPEQPGPFVRGFKFDQDLVAVERAPTSARRDPHRWAIVAIDVDDEAAAGHPPVSAAVKIGDFRREISLAPAEDNLTLDFEFLEHPPKLAPSIGAASPTFIDHLRNEHGEVHSTPTTAADGRENGLRIEIGRVNVIHGSDD